MIYELTVYAKDNHNVSVNREDRLRRTIEWFKNPPKKSISAALLKTIQTGSVETVVKQYHELKKSRAGFYDWSETELNQLGYAVMDIRGAKDAIEIFKLNVAAYPDSANVYDSLGEAYLAAGERDLAIKNYRRSLKLNPNNTNAADVLKTLESR